jgi:hypothetical protein
MAEGLEVPSIDRLLNNKWTLWIHLPNDPDWKITGYYKICTVSTIDETISIIESIPPALIKTSMFFIMKDGVKPIWEDPNNKNGGCFSYRVSHKILYNVWKNISYSMMGNMLISDDYSDIITGVSVSPKKQFSVLKVWTRNKEHTDPSMLRNIHGLSSTSCLFKSHVPEY